MDHLHEDAPRSGRDWRSSREGLARWDRWEYGLHTDAHVTDEVLTGIGPYALVNGRYFGHDAEQPSVFPRA